MGFRVVAVSRGAEKEAVARELGAHEYVNASEVDAAQALKALGGAKVIMCTAPNADVIQKLMPGLAIDGTLLLLALESTPITVSPSEHHDGSIERVAELTSNIVSMIGPRSSIRGWACGDAKDCEDCLVFAQAHDIKCMVETFPLEKAQEAYDHRSSARFRAVIVPGL